MGRNKNRHQLRESSPNNTEASPSGACLTLYQKKTKLKVRNFLLLPILLAGLLVGLFPQSPVEAASYNSLNAEGRSRSYGYYKAAAHCVDKMQSEITASSNSDGQKTAPLNGYWFGNSNGGDDPSHGNPVDVVPYKTGELGGRMGCANALNNGITKYWGMTYVDFLKGLGYEWDTSKGKWVDKGSGSRSGRLTGMLSSKGINTSWNDALAYGIYWITFNSICNAVDVPDSDTNKTFADSGKYTDKQYGWVYKMGVPPKKTVYTYQTIGPPYNHDVILYQGNPQPGRDNRKGCSTLTSLLSQKKYADAYLKEIITDKCKAAGVPVIGRSADSQREACIDGGLNPIDGESNKDYCKKYSGKEADACRKGQGAKISTEDAPGDRSGTETGEEGEEATSCVIEGIGWLVCPVINFISTVTDYAYGAVEGLLITPPLMTTGDTSGTYQAWKIMQGFANASFAIIFIFIIFSQLTSMGISNYGVKKMLPRLAIAAILVNVSFFISAIAVDLSNILGGSIKPLLDSISIPDPNPDQITGWNSETPLGSISAFVLAGAGIAAGMAFTNVTVLGALALLVPGILAAAAAILTVLVVLTIRQALIILLVVVSPLAFVAFLLPNTEDLFHKWRKLLMTLLLMYPIIAAIFGLSGLASTIVMNSSDQMLVQIAGALIAIIPLAITPIVMKTAGGLLNRIGAVVNNKEKGLFDRGNRAAAKFRKDQSTLRGIRSFDSSKKGFLGGNSVKRWRARRGAVISGREAELNRAQTGYISGAMSDNASFANAAAGGSMFTTVDPGAAQRAVASAINTTTKLELEEITAAGVVLKNAKLDQGAIRALADGRSISNIADKKTYSGTGAMRAAAIQQSVASNDVEQINKMWNDSKSWQGAEGSSLRNTLADSLAASSSRPGYIGQGSLASLRSGNGGHDDISSVIKSAIESNAYSPERIASADKDELEVVINRVNGASDISDDNKQQFMLNAEQAMSDSNLSVKISKNKEQVGKILTIS